LQWATLLSLIIVTVAIVVALGILHHLSIMNQGFV
jgi:hypothetical protein